MSTRGHVAIKENGKYKYIYNHHDSYIDGLGITLYKYYKDVNKVKELIALGNTSSIGSTVEEGGSKTYKEHLDKPLEQRGTVAAFRDINRWKDCSEKVTGTKLNQKKQNILRMYLVKSLLIFLMSKRPDGILPIGVMTIDLEI